jgi:hypothetical protein
MDFAESFNPVLRLKKMGGITIDRSGVLNENHISNQPVEALAPANTAGQSIRMLEFYSFLGKRAGGEEANQNKQEVANHIRVKNIEKLSLVCG